MVNKELLEAAIRYEAGMHRVAIFSFADSQPPTTCPIHGRPTAIMPGDYCGECWSEYHEAKRFLLNYALDAAKAESAVPTPEKAVRAEFEEIPCSKCDGRGFRDRKSPRAAIGKSCDTCNGTGKLWRKA